jgi:1-deoxy-D-xylulose-5-phosphate synthase
MNRLWHKWKRETKDFFVESSLFEKFGLRYIGPIDGHNLDELIKNLEFARDTDTPILLHVITEKGRGLDAARAHPEKFHGLGAFDPTTGEAKGGGPGTPPNYQDVFGKELVRLATTDKRIVGITAAMPSGTGLNHLATALPSQFFDVGIAEEHAALFAAGLATQGLKPVVAIYSTFLQRAYDPIIHDVALQRLPVVFCMDRAGLSPNDGATHHGLFDIAYLRPVPHALIMAPANEHDLADMMATALAYDGPAFIRYPRGACTGQPAKSARGLLPLGRAEIVRPGTDIVIWAIGTMVADALVLAESLATEDGLDVGVVNARFVKPLDRELLLRHASKARLIVTLEDHVATGGFGTAVLEALSDAGLSVPIERLGWPDAFIGHGSSQAALREAHGLSPASMLARVRQRLTAITKSVAVPAPHPQPLAIEV